MIFSQKIFKFFFNIKWNFHSTISKNAYFTLHVYIESTTYIIQK